MINVRKVLDKIIEFIWKPDILNTPCVLMTSPHTHSMVYSWYPSSVLNISLSIEQTLYRVKMQKFAPSVQRFYRNNMAMMLILRA